MRSINRMIMREIHNVQHDLSTCASGKELFDELQKDTALNQDTVQLLWLCRNQRRTFFGSWFNDGPISDGEDKDDPEIRELSNHFYQAMLLSGLEFESSSDPYPHDQLVNMLQHTLLDDYQMSSEEIYNLLAGLIDCETIAPWLLVCPVYGFSYADMVGGGE